MSVIKENTIKMILNLFLEGDIKLVDAVQLDSVVNSRDSPSAIIPIIQLNVKDKQII